MPESTHTDVEAGQPSPAIEAEALMDDDEHTHYSQRAPWLRAGVLGANDGLVSVASLMLGVGGGTDQLHAIVLAGLSGLVAGALSMAVGEYISVSSQRCAQLMVPFTVTYKYASSCKLRSFRHTSLKPCRCRYRLHALRAFLHTLQTTVLLVSATAAQSSFVRRFVTSGVRRPA